MTTFDADLWLKAMINSAESGTADSFDSALIVLSTFCWQVDRQQHPDREILNYLSRAFRKIQQGEAVEKALGLKRKKGKPKSRPLRDLNIAVLVKRSMIGCLTESDFMCNLHLTASPDRLLEYIEMHEPPRGRTFESACEFVGYVCELGPDAVKKIYGQIKRIFPEVFSATTEKELEERLYGKAE